MEARDEWQALGERVREARVAAQLSQGELATRIGLDRTALVKIEAGTRRISATELFRLADALLVPASYFVAPPRAAVVSRRTALVDDPDQAERTRWRLDTALDAHARDVEQLVDQDTDGASLLLDGHGGIAAAVIGGRRDPGSRRWTAAHELGHHLMGDEYHADVGVHSTRDEREKLTDAFAGELLVPADGLRRRWLAHDHDDERSRLIRVAADYRASWSAIVDAEQRAGLIDAGAAHRLRADRPGRGDFLATVGAESMADLEIGTTGSRWRQAVVQGYRQGVITAGRAVELLHGVLREDELPAGADPAA